MITGEPVVGGPWQGKRWRTEVAGRDPGPARWSRIRNRPDLVRRLLQPLAQLLLMLVLTQLSLCRARSDHSETAREGEIPPLLSAPAPLQSSLPPPPPPPAVLIAPHLFSMNYMAVYLTPARRSRRRCALLRRPPPPPLRLLPDVRVASRRSQRRARTGICAIKS